MNGKIMLNGKAYSSSGRPSREITIAQWLALPDTKYTDGIVYYIKDIGGANQFPPLIYSDEEREVGVWRDGKPIYEKTYTGSFTSSGYERTWYWILNASQVADIHIDTLIDIFGNCKDSYGQLYPIPNILGTSGVVIGSGITPSGGFGICYQNFSSGTNYYSVTMRYTKTTDTAGSGTWTTDGIYAKHYSASEKVIGTWIDGKPLYEQAFSKTLSGSPDSGGDSFIIAENITYIDTLVNMSGTVKKSNFYAFCSETGLIPTVGWSYSFHLKSNGQLVAWTSNNSSCYSEIAGGKAVAILQYTKTTD